MNFYNTCFGFLGSKLFCYITEAIPSLLSCNFQSLLDTSLISRTSGMQPWGALWKEGSYCLFCALRRPPIQSTVRSFATTPVLRRSKAKMKKALAHKRSEKVGGFPEYIALKEMKLSNLEFFHNSLPQPLEVSRKTSPVRISPQLCILLYKGLRKAC